MLVLLLEVVLLLLAGHSRVKARHLLLLLVMLLLLSLHVQLKLLQLLLVGLLLGLLLLLMLLVGLLLLLHGLDLQHAGHRVLHGAAVWGLVGRSGRLALTLRLLDLASCGSVLQRKECSFGHWVRLSTEKKKEKLT